MRKLFNTSCKSKIEINKTRAKLYPGDLCLLLYIKWHHRGYKKRLSLGVGKSLPLWNICKESGSSACARLLLHIKTYTHYSHYVFSYDSRWKISSSNYGALNMTNQACSNKRKWTKLSSVLNALTSTVLVLSCCMLIKWHNGYCSKNCAGQFTENK